MCSVVPMAHGTPDPALNRLAPYRFSRSSFRGADEESSPLAQRPPHRDVLVQRRVSDRPKVPELVGPERTFYAREFVE